MEGRGALWFFRAVTTLSVLLLNSTAAGATKIEEKASIVAAEGDVLTGCQHNQRAAASQNKQKLRTKKKRQFLADDGSATETMNEPAQAHTAQDGDSAYQQSFQEQEEPEEKPAPSTFIVEGERKRTAFLSVIKDAVAAEDTDNLQDACKRLKAHPQFQPGQQHYGFELPPKLKETAKCNDGSHYKFYWNPCRAAEAISGKKNRNVSDPAKWLFYLRSGGDAPTPEMYRKRPKVFKTRSTQFVLKLRAHPGLGWNKDRSDATDRTQKDFLAFQDFQKVILPYCSSDKWSGNADEADWTVNRKSGGSVDKNVRFHGSRIVKAVATYVRDTVKRTTLLDKAESHGGITEAILSGSSAGGAGTALNACAVFKVCGEQLEPNDPVQVRPFFGSNGYDLYLRDRSDSGKAAKWLPHLRARGKQYLQEMLDVVSLTPAHASMGFFLSASYGHIIMGILGGPPGNSVMKAKVQSTLLNEVLKKWWSYDYYKTSRDVAGADEKAKGSVADKNVWEAKGQYANACLWGKTHKCVTFSRGTFQGSNPTIGKTHNALGGFNDGLNEWNAALEAANAKGLEVQKQMDAYVERMRKEKGTGLEENNQNAPAGSGRTAEGVNVAAANAKAKIPPAASGPGSDGKVQPTDKVKERTEPGTTPAAPSGSGSESTNPERSTTEEYTEDEPEPLKDVDDSTKTTKEPTEPGDQHNKKEEGTNVKDEGIAEGVDVTAADATAVEEPEGEESPKRDDDDRDQDAAVEAAERQEKEERKRKKERKEKKGAGKDQGLSKKKEDKSKSVLMIACALFAVDNEMLPFKWV
eukprot:g8202.t1